ncbi:ATP-binding protein [Asanoa sp. WMMD1127]|uniref:ATP-binding protein n=1 Tax=Asanoa sp. WMMD1127 TaxID=3016107 RepID=UPI0024167070|nr:ATP-binding protein [Asanoa sp. WMMD1127]MDG4822081.1 ATP-binding protein [Asanoa sp. WMMD1127]
MTTAVAEGSWHVVVPHHARGARTARHRLTTELAGTVPDELLADVIAVTGELVVNAVRHARPLPGGVIRVDWRLSPAGVVAVRVTDGGGQVRPSARPAGPEALDGRGLHIVSALADRWGVDRDGHGQSVWAELGEHSHSLA